MDQKALPVCHLKLLFILFYYHPKIDLIVGKKERREKITQLKKQRIKEGMTVLACFGSTLTPSITLGPSKAHLNLLHKQETLKKTHNLSVHNILCRLQREVAFALVAGGGGSTAVVQKGNWKYYMIMSKPAWSTREALAASALAILLGGLVLVSLVVERDARTPLAAKGDAVGGRRVVIRANGRLAHQRRAVEDIRDDDDPFSSSKRRVPNGPDPIHNRGAGESGSSPGRA